MSTLPDGWLTDEEADELCRLCRGRVVLEMGAWKGRSTVVLAQKAKRVISIDRHQGIDGHGESLDEYLRNVRGFANVDIVIARFEEFVPMLRPFAIGMVYVDGDHDSRSIRRDTLLALRLGPEILAYHDWDFPHVRSGATRVPRLRDREPDSLVGSVASFKLW